jgi:hypothetical protein
MADPERDESADPSAAPSPSGPKRISLPPEKSEAELDALDWCNDRTKEALGQGFGFMPAPVERTTPDGVEYLDITAQYDGVGIIGIEPDDRDEQAPGVGPARPIDHDSPEWSDDLTDTVGGLGIVGIGPDDRDGPGTETAHHRGGRREGAL